MARYSRPSGWRYGMAGFLLVAAPAGAQSITEYPGLAGGTPVELLRGGDQNLWVTDTGLNAIVQVTTAGVATAFPIPTAGSQPLSISGAGDGGMWFVEAAGNNIGRSSLTGTMTEYPLPSADSQPNSIALGPDGNLWFTEGTGNRIGQITTAGTIIEFTVPTKNAAPSSIKIGPDGALWFTEFGSSKLGRITTAGAISEFPLSAGSMPKDLAPGVDGNLWALEAGTDRIAQVTTDGAILNEFPVPTANAGLAAIRRGPDGAMWFTETNAGRIGRVTMAGAVTETPTPTAGSAPIGLANGPDGNIWILESGTDKYARLAPVTNGLSLVAAVLPSSQSVELGTVATAFATILNANPTVAQSCAIVPTNGVANTFTYQTTDPNTNALTGTANTPVDIPANSGQSYLVAFNPTAVYVTETVSFGFYCANANPAPVTPEVNTLFLSASSTPVPNVIALAVSPSEDGILDLPGTSGSNAFAVATSNIGAAGTLKVTINPGAVPLPVDLAVCETEPSSGACLAAPTRSLTLTIDAGATPTFGFFATATGTIAFDPGVNRLIVRFLDSANVLHGETSLAVRTQ